MKKVTSFSLDEDLVNRLAVVSENHNLSRSSIVEDYLSQILPILEAETPNKMLAKAMQQLAGEIDTTATLFDNMEHDKSVEEYKKMKRG